MFLYQPKLPIFSGGSHLAHELVQHLIDRAVFVTGNEVSDDLVGEELITYLTSTLEGQDERPEPRVLYMSNLMHACAVRMHPQAATSLTSNASSTGKPPQEDAHHTHDRLAGASQLHRPR